MSMKKKFVSEHNEWKDFFNNYSDSYDKECFTNNTEFEVDFLIEELGLKPGDSLLDIGCGTGRHAVGLAKKGIRVTGVDISEKMLEKASKRASRAGVNVELICENAALFISEARFDAAISICEGAFSILGKGDCPYRRDMAILANIANALKPDGKFVLTVLNGFWAVREFSDSDVQSGKFDPVTMTQLSSLEDSNGRTHEAIERYYTPPELIRMLNRIGLKMEHIWGGTAGQWNCSPLSLDEMEIMVVGKRK